MSLIRCLGKVTVPISHTLYVKEKFKRAYSSKGYSNYWNQDILELDPRRKDVDLWDEDGRLTGNIVRSLTKREYQDQYLSLMGVTLPPPMDDPLVKKLSELYRGKQSHNLMFAQSVGWHDDDIYDQQRMCVVIPILTHGHHVLDVECNTVRLERGKIYLFNQRRQHQLRYDGKDPNLEGISRPCALLSVSFEKFRGYK